MDIYVGILSDNFHLLSAFFCLHSKLVKNIVFSNFIRVVHFQEPILILKNSKFFFVLLLILKAIQVSKNLDIKIQHQGLLVWYHEMFVYKMKIYCEAYTLVLI